MKSNYTFIKTAIVALFFSINSWSQTTIAQWNFNGADANSVPGGAVNPSPSVGTGAISLIGVSTSTIPFAAGVNSVGIGSSDPVTTNPPNLAWAVTNYASLGTEDRQRGIQVNVSTVGFAGITFQFDQRLSNKAGNTYVVLYTSNRNVANPVWEFGRTFTFTPAATGTGDIWYNQRFVDLIDFTALDNNPNVAIRIVGAFDPTVGDYLASTSTSLYDGTGVTRYDMITVKASTTLANTNFVKNQETFTVYPNPSNKEVVTFNKVQDVQIFDVLGKLVLSAKNTKTIDTREFKSGVYFIRTNSGYTTKLIIK